MELQITQQFGKLGLEINNVRYDQKQIKPDLEIKQKPADLDLEITKPDLKIDYTGMLESLGLGSMAFITRTYIDAAKQEYLADLEKVTQVGDQIGSIENEMSIGDILYKSLEPQDPEIELVSIAPIDITYIPATVKTKSQLGGVEYSFNYGKVYFQNFTFPSIRGYMEQEAYLQIKPVGQIFDQKE